MGGRGAVPDQRSCPAWVSSGFVDGGEEQGSHSKHSGRELSGGSKQGNTMSIVVQLRSREVCSGARVKVLVWGDAPLFLAPLCARSSRQPPQEEDSGPVTCSLSPVNSIGPSNSNSGGMMGSLGGKGRPSSRWPLGVFRTRCLSVSWPL